MANALKTALFPTKCIVCGSFFHIEQGSNTCQTDQSLHSLAGLTRIWTLNTGKNQAPSGELFSFYFNFLFATFLCPNCLGGFIPVESPLCLKCGVMFNSRQGDDRVCGECIKHPKEFQMARATGIYGQNLMEVIHRFKYNGKIQLAGPLGALLFATFIHYWDVNSIDLIIPVPLHIKRFRKRGFNQTFLLLQDWLHIAEDLNIELSGVRIDKEVLVRSRWTEPQTGLDRKKRLANIQKAFRVKDPLKVIERRILLVDDVYTTGATVNECAKMLLKASALKVDVLTLARAI